MTPIVTYKDGDSFSAAIAGGEVFCFQLPKALAAAAIVAKVDVTVEQAQEWLDSPVSPEVWKATHLSALTAGLDTVSEEVTAIQDREVAEKLKARVKAAMAMLTVIHNQQARANQLAEQANQIEADKVTAIEAETARRESEARLAAEARAEAERKEQAETLRRQDRRVARNLDGSVDVTQAIPGQRARKVIARYRSIDDCPPEIRASL